MTQIERQTKTCKQCGRELPIESFKQYPSRGRGIRKSSPGRFPTCRECETFNRHVNTAYKAVNPTEEQVKLIAAATEVYKDQISRGLQPIGALAKSLSAAVPKESPVDKYLQEHRPSSESDESRQRTIRLREMQHIPLTMDNYDEYEDELYELDMGKDVNTPEQKDLIAWHEDRLDAVRANK